MIVKFEKIYIKGSDPYSILCIAKIIVLGFHLLNFRIYRNYPFFDKLSTLMFQPTALVHDYFQNFFRV
jgi:asparagine N-glycosylation enzyme membrane subunit Stt3